MKKIIPFSWNFPLSSAIVHNCEYEMEISWQIWIDFESWELETGIEKQTERTMENIKIKLAEIGWDMSNIIKARIFLTNMEDYNQMNEVYATYFTWEYPTRFALEVSALPAWALVEIECKAVWDTIKQ